jgi:hypothetical protein
VRCGVHTGRSPAPAGRRAPIFADHDALVVTALAVPELEFALDDPDVEPELEAVLAFVVAVVAAAFAACAFAVAAAVLAAFASALAAFTVAASTSAGSFPVTSCTKIPPEVARNMAVAIAITRRRMTETLRLRALSRSATRVLTWGRAPLGAGARPAPGTGSARIEGSWGVIGTSLAAWKNATTKAWLRFVAKLLAAPKTDL